MRWDYGKIYKEIRKSKGLTQEEICGDFLARSTLARIESGQVVPKLTLEIRKKRTSFILFIKEVLFFHIWQ